ncbi:uncharacterized protein LOC113557398 [Rhopalosiphum maidis]|uniref:uncharacterized protein LOC113557398 n=1 Tax=Rhopalosiphum maidis TaxID=43146 RepID=UPI000EFED71D|nr:uncharacterized protein LOC113557398 [Rhopalosiphum maidis]
MDHARPDSDTAADGGADDPDGRLYDYLLDSGAFDDVRALAESIVGSSVSSSDVDGAGGDDGDDDDDDDGAVARRIADRLLEQNADDVDRALDAAVRDALLATGSAGRLVDHRWPGLVDIGPGRLARDTARSLNALLRLPFTYDTYTGAYFRRLTDGLSRAVSADVHFSLAIRVYAKLVDTAPDPESAAESYGSLCEATHARCLLRQRRDFGKTVTAVSLTARCLSVVIKRAAGCRGAVKPAIVEFVATIAADPGGRGPYAVLCCADPTATWFDTVSKYHSSRSVFFQCLDGDRKLLRAVVSGFHEWIVEPEIPRRSDDTDIAAVVRYARALHAVHLLAKMFRYRATVAMFPVKVSRALRIHAAGISNHCLGFLSANRRGVPATLAHGLCLLVAAVAAFHPETLDTIADNAFGLRILAKVAERSGALAARQQLVDGLFENRRWKDAGDGADVDSLTAVAATLTASRHDEIWRLITRRMSFLEDAAAGDPDLGHRRSLLTNVRGSPLGTLMYDTPQRDDFDWLNPRHLLTLSVACTTAAGRQWLDRTNAFGSLDGFVADLSRQTEVSLDPDGDRKSLDSIVRVAYSCCSSIGGLEIVLARLRIDGSEAAVTGIATLTEFYYASLQNFDGYPITRGVLVILWLRLIQAATHTFSSRVYADLKLKYQETLLKLSAESRTEDEIVFVDETTELLTKLQRPLLSDGTGHATESTPSALVEFLSNANHHHGGVWSQRLRSIIIRSDQITGTETMDLIASVGRRRFDGQLDLGAFDHKLNLTDFDVTGIRLALRYGSSVGLVAEDSVTSSELEQLYSRVERRGSPALFDCMTCTLFIASGGSKNGCIEACAVLLRLYETTRYVWPPAFDEDADRRAAFGHLVEGLLQQEQPEVYNAFKMSGVSWWLLCSGWASDCFWGRLNWSEICRWLCLVVVSPVDYQAFFFVCLAAAQKRRWMEAFNQGRFHDTVYQGDLGDFRLTDHAIYFEELAKKHQRCISKKLASEFDMH